MSATNGWPYQWLLVFESLRIYTLTNQETTWGLVLLPFGRQLGSRTIRFFLFRALENLIPSFTGEIVYKV